MRPIYNKIRTMQGTLKPISKLHLPVRGVRRKEAYGARRREYEPLFEHKKTAYSFLSHTRAGVVLACAWRAHQSVTIAAMPERAITPIVTQPMSAMSG